MLDGQLTIFEMLSLNRFEEALNEISIYGIDEHYRENFKGKGEILWKIKNSLSNLENYEKYYKKLYDVLKRYFEDSIDVEVYKNDDCIRIQSSRSRSDYPVYCLEMLSKEDR